MLRYVKMIGMLALVSVGLTACGDDVRTAPSRQDGPTASGDDPFTDVLHKGETTSYVLRAGLGDDLALIRTDYDGVARTAAVAVYRTPTGEWGALPLPDVHGYFELAGVGDTVMLGGCECVSDDCAQVRARFLVLDADRRSWREVPSDLPQREVDITGEDESGVAMAYQRTMDVAMFTLGNVNYAVDPTTGPVELKYDDAFLITDYGFSCLTDGVEIRVPGTSEGPAIVGPSKPVTLDGVVLLRDLRDPTSGFTQIATAPRIAVDPLSSICGQRAIIIHAGQDEHVFDLDTLQWTTRPSNYREVNNGITVAEGDRAQWALPDGAVYESNRTRSPDGSWTGIAAGLGLVSIGGGVLYANSEDGITVLREAS